MPLVEVVVNGRDYQVACDVGQEDRLRELAQQFDKRVQVLASSVGQVGDARLLLMAGLVITDELSGATAIKRLDYGVGQGDWKSTEGVADEVKIQYKVALVKAK